MKKRNFEDIGFEDQGDGVLIFRHLVGEMEVPCEGGGFILAAECGAGKSTGINSLVRLFPTEGFVLFEKTRTECDEVARRLVSSGVSPSDILVLHSDSFDYDHLHKEPAWVTQRRILIIPSIHLYLTLLPALLAYDGGRRVELEEFVGDLPKLMQADRVRRFVLIDEAPDFIKPFSEFNGVTMTNILSNYSHTKARNGVAIDEAKTGYLNPLPLDQMEEIYFARVGNSPNRLFADNSRHNELRAREVLAYISDHFSSVATTKDLSIYHNLNDIIVEGSRCNIYLFDATGGVLSNYKKHDSLSLPAATRATPRPSPLRSSR